MHTHLHKMTVICLQKTPSEIFIYVVGNKRTEMKNRWASAGNSELRKMDNFPLLSVVFAFRHNRMRNWPPWPHNWSQ